VRQHRHPSLIRHLLPDHHVYVRSGSSSRYVVLAWPWQVGAGLAVVGLVLWTGLASYGWIAAHLESREQRREVARLAQVNQRLEAAYAPEQASAAPAAIARLVVDLEEIKAGQGLALRLAETAAADEPRPQPLPGEAGVAAGGKETGTIDDRLGARLVPAAIHVDDGRQGRDWLYDRLTRPLVDGPARTAEMIRLRAQLRAARAEIARLKGAPGESGDPALR
jgi:hypothetical protein